MSSRSVNVVFLLGNLGSDAEARFTTTGKQYCRLSVATTRRIKRGDEWVGETTWHQVVVWQCENLVQYLTKGTQVHIQGRLQTRSWEKDGKKHFATEVISDELILLGSGKRSESRQGGEASGDPAGTDYGGITDDDVPF